MTAMPQVCEIGNQEMQYTMEISPSKDTEGDMTMRQGTQSNTGTELDVSICHAAENTMRTEPDVAMCHPTDNNTGTELNLMKRDASNNNTGTELDVTMRQVTQNNTETELDVTIRLAAENTGKLDVMKRNVSENSSGDELDLTMLHATENNTGIELHVMKRHATENSMGRELHVMRRHAAENNVGTELDTIVTNGQHVHCASEVTPPLSLSAIQVKIKTQKAIQIQSPRIQCCLCAFSVFSALFGMFMMSAGICLVLNYNFMEVDTSGLPSHLHNEEGKKVVGIILLCVGLGSLGLSALVSTLYFTACLERGSSQTSVGPEGGVTSGGQSDRSLQNGGHSARPSRSLEGHHHHGNGGTPGRSSPAFNGAHPSSRRSSSSSSLRFQAMVSGQKRAGSLPALGKDGPSYSQRMHAARTNISTPPSVRSQQKSRKKAMRHGHHGKFQNPLTSHPEEEEQSLNESRSRSMSGKRRSTSRSPERQRGGHVNYGADLNDDSVLTREPSGSSESSTATPPIKVDSSHLRNETYTNDAQYSEIDETGSSGETTQLSDQADEVDSTVFRVNPRVDKTRDFDEGDQDSGVKVEEEESGRWSRSTDSLGESETGAESFEEAKKRLDDRMQQVIE